MFFFRLISHLPLFILYRISDFLYFIIYHVIGYRKKVVNENLRKSFPEKSGKEIEQITKEFYLNLTDLIVETIKTLSISKIELSKRVKNDLTIPFSYTKQGKSIIVL